MYPSAISLNGCMTQIENGCLTQINGCMTEVTCVTMQVCHSVLHAGSHCPAALCVLYMPATSADAEGLPAKLALCPADNQEPVCSDTKLAGGSVVHHCPGCVHPVQEVYNPVDDWTPAACALMLCKCQASECSHIVSYTDLMHARQSVFSKTASLLSAHHVLSCTILSI